MPPRAVLVGLPGAGKSTISRELAGLLGLAAVDSDDLVIAATGRSIREVFAVEGEAAFRALEADAISTALREFDGVLALGGGAVTTETVRAAIQGAGVKVVWLTADLDELLRRMTGTADRPLLLEDPAGRLAELARQREPIYRRLASLIIPTGGRTPTEVATDVQRQL
ncbi:MAG: hypothetical protein JWN95_2948 [Frankiales bacterium]|nr:hypothetical protein [Frankiales bacterium]